MDAELLIKGGTWTSLGQGEIGEGEGKEKGTIGVELYKKGLSCTC